MSDSQHKPATNVDTLLRTQQRLIEAHLSLVKMQQQILGNTHAQIASDHHDLRSVASAAELPNRLIESGLSQPVGVADKPDQAGFGAVLTSNVPEDTASAGVAPGVNESAGSALRSPPDAGSLFDVLRRNAVFVGTMGVIAGLVLVFALMANPQSDNVVKLRAELEAARGRYQKELTTQSAALTNNQSELTITQKTLLTTQAKLTEVQQALLQSQEALRQVNEAKNDATRAATITTSPVEYKPLTNEQRLTQTQQDLRNLRTALVANQSALIQNLREYSLTAKALAVNRQSIHQAGLEIRHMKGEISAQELDDQGKSWEDFLSGKARALLNDPRLNIEPVAIAVSKGAPEMKDEVPATLPEVLLILDRTHTELTTVMKQLTDTQADIIQTQTELTAAQTELAKKSDELRALENRAASAKPVVASPTQAQTPAGAVGKANTGSVVQKPVVKTN